MHDYENMHQPDGYQQLTERCRQLLRKLKIDPTCQPLSNRLSKLLSIVLINFKHLSVAVEVTINNAMSDRQKWPQNYNKAEFPCIEWTVFW